MSQPHPTLINLPQPPSNPDTPSEIPGTPTSTTTSLSALSTTAIKDGHRGALHHRGHHHSPSTNSLEAERADRISRLAGLGSVSTLRGPTAGAAQYNAGSPQPTSASAGYPLSPAAVAAAAAAGLTPAYFNAAGQPVAINKVSTVGSASATESVGGHTSTTEVGGDQDTERDEDMLTEMDSASASGYMGGDTMDEDLDNLGTQSVGGFEDRMSDDGSASLVGFGEGAGSTVSGPIYQRRPLPAQGPNPPHGVPGAVWGLERTSSGLSEGAGNQYGGGGGGGGRRDGPPRPSERDTGAETPVSQSAVREQREARMMDGVALDSSAVASVTGAPITTATLAAAGADDTFVDTTTRGPVPVSISASSQSTPSTARQTWSPQPHSHPYSRQLSLGQSASSPPPASPPPRETAERIIRERLDGGEGRVGNTALGSPKGEGERLGKFYFEGHSR